MAAKYSDPVAPELRRIERQIDNSYKTNLLTKSGFATAAWYLMATWEDKAIKPFVMGESLAPQHYGAIKDRLIEALNHPLRWLYVSCPIGGEIPYRNTEENYNAALELLTLADNYTSYCAAFTYASQGIIELELQNTTIVSSQTFADESRFEAYNRLVKASPQASLLPIEGIHENIERSLKVRGDRFNYKLNPKLVKQARSVLQPLLAQRFSLPNNWQFSRYSLGDFRHVYETILAMMFIHFSARLMALKKGCVGMGYIDSIRVFERDELLRRIVNYTDVPESNISAVLDDLTYGSQGVSTPDPAIQPLVALHSNLYGLMPSLWIDSNGERNFTVLLNKLPSEQSIYSQLVTEKEELMRRRMINSLSSLGYRFSWGAIPGSRDLPDIDLAIISDREKVCILLEMKWFIEPAEIREVIDKSEELKKGVAQLIRLKNAFESDHRPLFDKLGIDSSYIFGLVVVSANWIGHADVQNPAVIIIKDEHIIQKLMSTQSLRRTIEWLSRRDYLPRKGVHYEVQEILSTISNWSLKWYGIKPLISDDFCPS